MVTNFKGLILAAGFGTRLRPLTDLYPKPLVPFLGTTPLALAINALNKAGIREIAINAHHLPEQVAAFVGQYRRAHANTSLILSQEQQILGTGGALNPLREWLGDANLVIMNGDVVSTIDVQYLIDEHQRLQAAASMALLPQVIPGESSVFHNQGFVSAIGKDLVIPMQKAGNFACAQVLTPNFINLLPRSGSFDIVSAGYRSALSEGLKVGAVLHEGYWHDIRSPQYYWKSLAELLMHPGLVKQLGIDKLIGLAPEKDAISPHQCFVHPTAKLARSTKIGPNAIIESGCEIGEGASVSESVILPNTAIASGETIHRLIIGPNIRVQLDDHQGADIVYVR